MYDRKSFEHLSIWAEDIIKSKPCDESSGLPIFILIGNKRDLDDQWIKPIQQGEIDMFCETYDVVSYYPISAKFDKEPILDLITQVAHDLYFHIEFTREFNVLEYKKAISNGSAGFTETRIQRLDVNRSEFGLRTNCCLLV